MPLSQDDYELSPLARSINALRGGVVRREEPEDQLITIRFQAFVDFMPQAFEEPSVHVQLLVATPDGDRLILGRLQLKSSLEGSGIWHSYVFCPCWQAEVAYVRFDGLRSNVRKVIVVTEDVNCRVNNDFFRPDLAERLRPLLPFLTH
jgi:hypothetical protein